MSTAALHLVAVVGLLAGAGYLPARAVVGDRVLALAVAPLVTALGCAAAGAVSLVTKAPLGVSLSLVFALAWAGSIVAFRRRPVPARPPAVTPPTSLSPWHLAFLVGVVAVPLLAVRRAPVDWDARSIWFFHADWFWTGGAKAVAAFDDPSLAFSHPDYPPLAPGTAASVWTLLGRDLELAQLTFSLLGASALVTMAAVLALVTRVPRRCSAGIGAALILAAYGMAAGGGTNGYVDLLWAAAFAAGAIGLLLGESNPAASVVGAICVAVAMLTKNEGMVAGVLLLAAVVVTRRWRSGLVLAAAPMALAAVWALTARALGAEGDLASQGRLSGLLRLDSEVLSRAGPTLAGMWRWCRWELIVAVAVAAVGVAVARRDRTTMVGHGVLRLWVAVAGCLASLLLAYLISPHGIEWHLRTSVDRTTLAPRLLLLVDIAVWVMVLAARPRDRGAPPPPPDEAPAAVEPAPAPARPEGIGVAAGAPER